MRSATGGPAFPVPGLQHDEDFNGMTLRDYFAGQIVAAMIGGANGVTFGPDHKETNGRYAAVAYVIADAMLAERAK